MSGSAYEPCGRWHTRLPIEAYASRTGTRKNLDALRRAGWRLMVSARGVLRHEGMPYALDNGAWTAFQNGETFDESAFGRAVDAMGEHADFVVVPDIVAGGLESLEFSLRWLDRLCGLGAPMALAVQDGMTAADVTPHLGAGREKAQVIFVGGSTEWKLASLPIWMELARQRHVHCHVGRVNTLKRIKYCVGCGANSFDGSGPSRFASEIPKLDACRRTHDIFNPPPQPWQPETDAERAYWDYYDLGNAAFNLCHS